MTWNIFPFIEHSKVGKTFFVIENFNLMLCCPLTADCIQLIVASSWTDRPTNSVSQLSCLLRWHRIALSDGTQLCSCCFIVCRHRNGEKRKKKIRNVRKTGQKKRKKWQDIEILAGLLPLLLQRLYVQLQTNIFILKWRVTQVNVNFNKSQNSQSTDGFILFLFCSE